MFTYLIIAVLIAVIALLWYAVRTHKTVADLKAKAEKAASSLDYTVKKNIDQ